MSTFKVPLIHLSLFKTGLGLFRSCRNLYRSSSLSLSPSCLKKLDTVNVTGGNESNMAPTSPEIVNNQLTIQIKCLKSYIPSLFADSFGISVEVEAIEVELEAAQDDLLSLLSKEPLRVRLEEVEMLSLGIFFRNCSKLDVDVFLSKLFEAEI